jgi:hypothetical protein
VAPWLSLDHHLAILRAMWEQHPSELFVQVRVPVLLLPADDGSPWTFEKRAATEAAAAKLADVHVQWFVADHDVHAQHPAAVASALHEFVR